MTQRIIPTLPRQALANIASKELPLFNDQSDRLSLSSEPRTVARQSIYTSSSQHQKLPSSPPRRLIDNSQQHENITYKPPHHKLDNIESMAFQLYNNPSDGRGLPLEPRAVARQNIDTGSSQPQPSAPPPGRLIDISHQHGRSGGGESENVLSFGVSGDVIQSLEFATGGGNFANLSFNLHTAFRAFDFTNISGISFTEMVNPARLGNLTPPNPTLGLFAHGKGPMMRVVH